MQWRKRMGRLAIVVFSLLLILLIAFQLLGTDFSPVSSSLLDAVNSQEVHETEQRTKTIASLQKSVQVNTAPQGSIEAKQVEAEPAQQSSKEAKHLEKEEKQRNRENYLHEKATWVDVVPPWARSSQLSSVTVMTDKVPENENLKSQYGEDRFMLNDFFFRQGNGTFIEMGALNGKRYSNTFALDKDLGWKGILIEGDPENFKLLPKNRPGQILVNAAVCQQRQQVHYVKTGESSVRGIFEFMSEEFKKKWHSTYQLADQPTVQCVPMVEILSRYGISHFNLWSLDVEGAELDILKSMDFARFTFDILFIEAHHTSPEKNALIWDLVNKTGLFNFHGHHWANYVWLSKTFTPHCNPATAK